MSKPTEAELRTAHDAVRQALHSVEMIFQLEQFAEPSRTDNEELMLKQYLRIGADLAGHVRAADQAYRELARRFWIPTTPECSHDVAWLHARNVDRIIGELGDRWNRGVPVPLSEELPSDADLLAWLWERLAEVSRPNYESVRIRMRAELWHALQASGEISPIAPSAEIPKLNKTSGEWVTQSIAAKREHVKISSLGTLRGKSKCRWKSQDSLSGIDESGRMWRKESRTSKTIWYYVPSFLCKDVSSKHEKK